VVTFVLLEGTFSTEGIDFTLSIVSSFLEFSKLLNFCFFFCESDTLFDGLRFLFGGLVFLKLRD
jgi:hypothetical protein